MNSIYIHTLKTSKHIWEFYLFFPSTCVLELISICDAKTANKIGRAAFTIKLWPDQFAYID